MSVSVESVKYVENVVPTEYKDFFAKVSASWSRESSNDVRWSHPSAPRELGQCAVTAMVVQDMFGGEIVRGVVTGSGSHYWNRIDDTDVDFTRGQFAQFNLEGDVEIRDRSYLEENTDTLARYQVLKDAVN